ncbi:MAG TPA: hypothetical protein VM432_14660 [Bdellovibrionales bacterium]|jgi:hypothetical protein|nr:hypothetical protein [Bdellovibrionales bacterium]
MLKRVFSFRMLAIAVFVASCILAERIAVFKTDRASSVSSNEKDEKENGMRLPASVDANQTQNENDRFFLVRDHKDLMSLSAISRRLYIQELQKTVLEAAELLDEETQFASVDTRAKLQLFAALLGVERAEALGNGSCIYAGWLNEYEGRYCKRPPSCANGARGEVQCNPMVFGPDVCAKIGRSATAECKRKSGSLSEIVKYVEANPDEWNQLKSGLDSYCPSKKQRSLCAMIQSRIVTLEMKVSTTAPKLSDPASDSPPAVVIEAVTEEESPQAPRRAAAVDAVEVQRARPQGVAPAAVGPSVSKVQMDSSQKEPGTNFKGQRHCIWSELMFDIRVGSDIGEPIVSYDEAYQVACQSGAFSSATISQARARARGANAQIARASGVDKQVLRLWNDRTIKNFEACLAESQRRSAQPKAFERNVELVRWSSQFTQGRGFTGILAATPVEHAAQISSRGIHLCNTVLRGGSAPQYSAPGGAVQ